MPSIEELVAFASHAVQLAGVQILQHFRAAPAIHNKADGGRFDPVTIADRAAEEIIRRELQRVFPEHGICGEEGGDTPGSSPYTWYIDPIDGTRAFILGQLHWGTLLGCSDGNRPIIGVMHQPYTGEMFVGTLGGTELRRAGVVDRLRTHARTSLAEAFLCATDPTMFADPSSHQAFSRLAAQCRAVRWGGDCYTPCLVAAGHADLVVDASLKAWDIQPLIPIVEGAGGIITNWNGEPAMGSDRVVIAANATLHAQALEALQG